MHHHQVTFIGESDLPEGHDWALVRRGIDYHVFIKSTAVTPATLMECWEAFLEMEMEALANALPIPAPRPSLRALPSGSRA